jgi:hypothetical protein
MQYYIGTSALAKTMIGYVAGKVARDINKEATSLIVIVVFVACFLKGIIMFFTVAIFHSSAHAASLHHDCFARSAVYRNSLDRLVSPASLGFPDG